MITSPIPSTSLEKAVGATSVPFLAAMVAGQFYMFVSSTNCWIAQGATGTTTASAGAGSMFVPANTIVLLNGHVGVECAVIEDSVSGKASLTQVQNY